jgi:hypothetical protein
MKSLFINFQHIVDQDKNIISINTNIHYNMLEYLTD